ncbi:MAG: acyl-CoA dehydrogenase [Sphingomonadales bacterium]|nr:MAG: acyl-CoA dehydrogenase [Sphingomonadales bacterium]
MSENRTFFRETVERILADTLTHNHIEATERRELPAALYAALAENGVTLMLVPEESGGIGASVGDAVAILRAMGTAAAPGPILETILGNALLAKAGLDPVEGTIALAFADDNATALHDVAWGGVADHVLIVTPTGLCLTASSDWTVTPGLDAADEPRDTLTDGPNCSVTPFDTSSAKRTAAILRAGHILGAVEWTLVRSIDYAGERKQFGREISKFQVIQQMLAELAAHLLASTVLTEAAAESLSDTMIAAARSRLGDAADAAITIGHQVHGAIGFSREYALNHRTRRLMAWRDDFGSVLEWRRALAGAFVTCSREEFWPAVSDAGLKSAD